MDLPVSITGIQQNRPVVDEEKSTKKRILQSVNPLTDHRRLLRCVRALHLRARLWVWLRQGGGGKYWWEQQSVLQPNDSMIAVVLNGSNGGEVIGKRTL